MTPLRYQKRHGAKFATIEEFWRDPAPFEAEREVEQAKLNARIDAVTRKNHPHIGDGE